MGWMKGWMGKVMAVLILGAEGAYRAVGRDLVGCQHLRSLLRSGVRWT